MIRLLLTLALMCENVNAAPQVPLRASIGEQESHADSREVESSRSAVPVLATPATAAPFTLAHPLCQTGFTIAMRYDTRNAAGTIIKSVWVRKCTKGKIIYGGKV